MVETLLIEALPRTVMDNLADALIQRGLQPQPLADHSLKADLAAFGTTYGYLYASDIRLFFEKGCSSQEAFQRFSTFQNEQLFDFEDRNKTNYLLLVIPEAFRDDPALADFVWQVGQDTQYARKLVCFLEDLDTWLGNPFAPWSVRAKAPSRVRVCRWAEPQDLSYAVTADFDPRYAADWFAVLATHPKKDELQRLVSTLVRRILGFDYHVVWDQARLLLKLSGPQGQTRLSYNELSSGVQRIVAFSTFLALQYAGNDPELCLRIRATLNGLDALRHYNAVDCLRDFILATGACVVFETDNARNYHQAHRKLNEAAELANKA